jgi:hypothetical protein
MELIMKFSRLKISFYHPFSIENSERSTDIKKKLQEKGNQK